MAWEDEWEDELEEAWEEEEVPSFRSTPEAPDQPQQGSRAVATAEPTPETAEPERIDSPAAIPSEEAPQAALPPPAASEILAQPEPAHPVAADESSEHAEAIPQSRETSRIEESTDTHPPLPPLVEVRMPEYTTREQQLLWRIKYPVRPFPLADFQRVAENTDRFRAALLHTVQMMLDQQVKQDLMAERYNFMGYAAAIYILAGSRDPALLPLLLRIVIDPDLARFHLHNENWLAMPLILATVAQEDPAPVLSLAEWRQLPVASRGLILRTLNNLFLSKRIPREPVVQALRQAFEIGTGIGSHSLGRCAGRLLDGTSA